MTPHTLPREITLLTNRPSIPNVSNAMDKHLRNTLISAPKAVIDDIIEHHAKLAPSKSFEHSDRYKRLLLYLYLPTEIYKGQTAIPRRVLAFCEGVPLKRVEQNNYCGLDFLRAFKAEVMPNFEFINYKKGTHPRLVRFADLDTTLLYRLHLNPIHTAKDRVFVFTGEPWTLEEERAARRQLQKLATDTARDSQWIDQKEVIMYMNKNPRNSFSKAVSKHISQAKAEAMKIQDRTKRVSCLQTLHAIEEQPQPFVKVSKRRRTPRVFPASLSLYSLPKTIRHVLTQDWYEADLSYAQTAINARNWHVEDVLTFLGDSSINWWDVLIETVLTSTPNCHDYNLVKAAVKTAVYSVQFGMKENRVIYRLNRALPMVSNPGERLVQHRLMRALIDGRDNRVAQINAEGGIRDAYGNWFPLGGDVDAKSLLATEAQSWEMKLMRPVLDVAKDRPNDLRIMLWIHDAVVINFTKRGQHENAARREIVKRVTDMADALGIPTSLDFE